MAHFPDKMLVLAADSTAMSTQLLVEALARNAQFEVIEAPSSESEILSLVQRERPDVALISSKLGDNSQAAFDLIHQIRAEQPGARVVVLLDNSEPAAVVEAFRAGAHGIFCRTQPLRLLAKCIECVHSGQVWANSSEVRFALEALSAAPTIRAIDARGLEILSAREIEVVQHLAEGLTNRAIGNRMGLSPHTIKNYVLRIFEKLGVSNRVELLKLTLSAPPSHPRPHARKESHGLVPAVAWCQSAAEKGSPHAQLLLADLCRTGEVVPCDLSAAYYWYCLCEKTNPDVFAPMKFEREKVQASLSPEQIEKVRTKIAQTPDRPESLKPMTKISLSQEAKPSTGAPFPRAASGD